MRKKKNRKGMTWCEFWLNFYGALSIVLFAMFQFMELFGVEGYVKLVCLIGDFVILSSWLVIGFIGGLVILWYYLRAFLEIFRSCYRARKETRRIKKMGENLKQHGAASGKILDAIAAEYGLAREPGESDVRLRGRLMEVTPMSKGGTDNGQS